MPLEPKIFRIKITRYINKEHLQMVNIIYSNNETIDIPYLDYLGEKHINRKLRNDEIVIDFNDDQKNIFVCKILPANPTQRFIKIVCLCPICNSVFYPKLHRVLRMLRQGLSLFCGGNCRTKFNNLKGIPRKRLIDEMMSFKFIEKGLKVREYYSNENPYIRYKLLHSNKHINP